MKAPAVNVKTGCSCEKIVVFLEDIDCECASQARLLFTSPFPLVESANNEFDPKTRIKKDNKKLLAQGSLSIVSLIPIYL